MSWSQAHSRHVGLARILSEFEQFEAERLDLGEDAEQRGPILEQAREHGLAFLDFRPHGRKGGQSGSTEPPSYPNHVLAAALRGHSMILGHNPVSGPHRNLVILFVRVRSYFGGDPARAMARSRSSRACRTAELRSLAPSLE